MFYSLIPKKIQYMENITVSLLTGFKHTEKKNKQKKPTHNKRYEETTPKPEQTNLLVTLLC